MTSPKTEPLPSFSGLCTETAVREPTTPQSLLPKLEQSRFSWSGVSFTCYIKGMRSRVLRQHVKRSIHQKTNVCHSQQTNNSSSKTAFSQVCDDCCDDFLTKLSYLFIYIFLYYVIVCWFIYKDQNHKRCEIPTSRLENDQTHFPRSFKWVIFLFCGAVPEMGRWCGRRDNGQKEIWI